MKAGYEQTETARSGSKKNSWITPYVAQYRWRLVAVIALGICATLCAVLLLFTSGFLISKSALRPENILMVYVPIVGVRAFGIFRAVFRYVERLAGHDAVLRILADQRVKLYQILEPQALFLRSRMQTGDVLGALAEDVERLQDIYLRTVFPAVTALMMYGGAVVVFGSVDLGFALWMGLYMLFLVAVLPAISLRVTWKLRVRLKRENAKLYTRLTDGVLGLGDWIASGRAEEFVRQQEEAEGQADMIRLRLRQWTRWRDLVAQCVIGLMVVSVTLWAGSAASAGQLPAVMIAAFVLVLFPLTEALLPVGDAVEHIPQYRESLERLQHLEGEEHLPEQSGTEEAKAAAGAKDDMTTGISGSNPVEGQQLGSLERKEKASDRRIRLRIPPRLRADIQIDQVSYRYTSGAPLAVQEVSLHLPQGKHLAILGRSGGGKSTLLKLIQGALLPSAGNIFINDLPVQTMGENITDVIAVLNQSPHLFDTTVANNLRIGRPHATDEEIQRVAAQVGLSDLIESLPQGYHTPMLETGLRFSGGERQRIALARVLLRETPVVIFDEPTVGLDPVTERALMRTILDSMQGKTMIWVTHHLMGVERMDELIFMENGQITMQGSHEQLLAREERYRRLVELDRPGWTDGQQPVVLLPPVASR
ncbi:ATP-binding cassette, subfamily C, CydC [Paenibacillus sp. ov031]|uniref:thiol reductant ABC exporter subunit CydC n=1 Tax=unclassified Paenibacillus TaxID=185978 RepID=UPI00089D07C0|nr:MULTISPECIES: thiol reductant ABC exporter subunit CydC [unclassified Paenibacillus]SEB19396.1 ATP-binding cassette, subfamily C, CydC [Paenibacillus sp. 276b]SHN68645.1 ATP-binding cassette, subfamily C, CydC [Paenibacillus sp. ov031]